MVPISSTLLALNYLMNFDSAVGEEYCVICVAQDVTSDSFLDVLESRLSEFDRGRVLRLTASDDEVAFTVILNDPAEGLNVLKRSLWESGVLLSTKIVQITLEIEMIKDYGTGA